MSSKSTYIVSVFTGRSVCFVGADSVARGWVKFPGYTSDPADAHKFDSFAAAKAFIKGIDESSRYEFTAVRG